MSNRNFLYPFTGIVGQEKMKEALVLNIINPALGGVLIRGEKGTAKSTLVRGLASLLAERNENHCEFHCDPEKPDEFCDECLKKYKAGEEIQIIQGKMKVVNLPISATEDRVVGTLDIEHAIKNGEKKFEKGILAQSNRNILYVDEINLLDDHIVDVLLDSAAMGVNSIEREGISFSHPAKFVLVGTMNPEEGDLRPQLLDRFGLVVDVAGEKETIKRVEVVKRRLEFEADPEKFIKKYEKDENELKEKIEKSKKILKNVKCSDEMYEIAAKISIALNVDGHRADISVIKTAITIAAYEGREDVSKKDMLRAAVLTLPHRMRKTPFEDGVLEENKLEKLIESL
ncbi:ATP-binding protein [Fusobacterium ulcerans]|jgi:magnesium chelatase subunit I|uniref:ATP-binding protein n=1 Tax=Fusobacterium ulcerans TaxID=861 RepID=UPI001D0A93EC|nr:AAA family ATPase [Fusobacterium ulcerans]MCB8564291.1 AAA family ATPase [Fusobacterium ulcerans]MCB8648121.1 AAA family ATPase [Fusobacterium ulcerans]